ncbi:MAG TPA: CheR family methyltransferase [Gemmatimonadaceae bacterium]|nr:CheR family methyltransferase [Gemmatimonadaceae bacterium]
MSATSEREFETLLDYLKRIRGFDFTGYKRPSLARRIQKRMSELNVAAYSEYQDYLEVHAEEFSALFNTILINVTGFFRDEGSWAYLAEHVLPPLLARKESAGSVRVWSAGCASGEEAYTLAMLLAEQVGLDGFRDRIKIYATDVDEDALAKARQGVYTENDVSDVAEPLRKKYFDVVDGHYVFRKDLRRQVIFGRHDLITDAPISRVDLLVCRNTLMYLNAETQAKILARFHFALSDGGVLFLGRAETLLTHAITFEPIDLKRRISTKVSRGSLPLRDRLLLIAASGNDDVAADASQHLRLREMAMDAMSQAQVVVDAAGTLVHANDRARTMFALIGSDLGRPLQDLRMSYRPIDLRSLIDQARTERRTVVMRDVEWQASVGDARYMDIHVSPMVDAGTLIGVSVTFSDVSAAKRLQRELEIARQELETAYEELQSTNEELETTNEELQSTVEELETTNEELQSTNEELETMNEELQSTNEELTTMNDELRDRGHELTTVNLFLESVLASIEGAVIVVNTDLHIIAWSRRSQDLWGLREDEVMGKNLFALDSGLPVAALRAPLKQLLSGTQSAPASVEVEVVNRRGRAMHCRVSLSLLKHPTGETRGVILLTAAANGEELDGTRPPVGEAIAASKNGK